MPEPEPEPEPIPEPNTQPGWLFFVCEVTIAEKLPSTDNRAVYYYIGGAVFFLILLSVIIYVIYTYGRQTKFTHMSAIGSLFMEGEDTEVFSDVGIQLDESLTSDDLWIYFVTLPLWT